MPESVLAREPERLEQELGDLPSQPLSDIDEGDDDLPVPSSNPGSTPSLLALALCSLTHLACIALPRWAPTPAFKSSVLFRTRHTRRGHRGSSERRGSPWKRAVAA